MPPFDYNALSRAARAHGPDGFRTFPAFEDDGGDLACVLRDLRHIWSEYHHVDAAVAAAALLALAERLRSAEADLATLRAGVRS
jgi:predicted ATPase